VEVPYGTKGSIRPDWCINNVCSIEVKNYNIATNSNGLVNNVAKQAADRAVHLPQGMQQRVFIDIRGQAVSTAQQNAIKQSIVSKTNGIIRSDAIRFMEE
jgi:filamentous hemagglutinin